MRKRTAIVSGLVVVVVAALAVWWLAGRGQGGARRSSTASTVAGAGSGGAGRAASGAAALPDPRQQKPAEIRGTVREKGGGPIAGAQVCSTWWDEGLDSAARREPVCARTDAAGAYRLAPLVPANHTVSASAPQHEPARWRPPRRPSGAPDTDDGDADDSLDLEPGEVRAGVDLELPPGGVEVKGVVADINGGPIADARVTLQSGSWWRGGSATTRADAQGRFSLWGRAGTIELSAEAEGYADGDTTAVAPAQAVEILLTPESSLGGVVVEAGSGAPVPDVLVEVSREDEPFRWGGAGASARTGADGRFRLDRLEPGRYKPTATGRGAYGEPADSVLLGLGQRVDDVRIEVHPARVVSGKVAIEEDGKQRPCKRGMVSLSAIGADRRYNAGTEDDGTVELTAVRPGRYSVSVNCDRYLERDHYDPVVIADADVDGLVWTVSAGGSVRGVVRTAGGEPVADVTVMAQTVGGAARAQRSWGSDTSEDDGSFELTGLVAGDYQLRVWSDEHRAPEPPPKVTVALGKETRADVVLAASGTVAGIVVDTDGKPVAGAQIRVASGMYFSFGGGGARSGEDGRFLVKGVEPGERRVLATRGWGDELRRPGTSDDDVQGEKVTVVAGKTANVRLVVESRSGVITGTVKDEQGEPVGDAWVVTSRESDAAGALAGGAARETRWSWGRDDRPVVTDTAGAFTVRDLSPGTYSVRAFRRGGGEAVAEHVAVGGSVALVIRATGVIAGTVALADGGAPEEVTVSVSDAKTGFSRRESFYRTGGRFTMRDLPAGAFVVSASDGAGRAVQDVTLAAGEQRTDLRLVLEANVTVRGRMVDLDTNAPVPGMDTRLMPRKGSGESFTFTMDDDGERKNISGDDGRFELERAPTGAGYLAGFPRSFRDGAYGFVRWPVDVPAGVPVVDVGDIPVPKRRIEPGQQPGDLGISFVQQPPELEPAARELKVSKVRVGSPADGAGVKVGDVIVSVDGHDVRGARSSLSWTLMNVPVGTKLALGLARGETVNVTAAAPP